MADPTPDNSRPKLPVEESDGVYGDELKNTPDRVQVWEFPWGKWLVNATAEERSVEVPDTSSLKRLAEGEGARFFPLEERPVSGSWSAEELSETVTLPAMSQAILVNPETCGGCLD